MKNILLFIFIVSVSLIIAQPANNTCGGAITQAQNGSCIGGTNVGATDTWVGAVGCQSGNNHPEVWYTFNATGTQAVLNITNGTMPNNIEITLVSATGPCAGLVIVGAVCGPSPLSGTFATVPGTTYYYTISSSTGGTGTFTTCLTSSSPPPAPGQNCSNAAILCNANVFSQGTSSAGIGVQEVTTGNSCWGSGGERQSKWFKFSVGCSGTLEFNINPVVSGDDYDFGIWNITSDPTGCTTKGNTIGCNWSGCKGSTGLSSCPLSEPGVVTGGAGCFGGPAAWSAPINVTAGNVYAVLVDNFSTSNSGFALTFGGGCAGGTAKIGPNAIFTAVISNSCMTATVTKSCAIATSTNSTYFWNFGDGFTSTAQGPIAHTYTVTGNYNISLSVTDLLGCVTVTSQTVNIGCVVLPVELINFTATFNKNSADIIWETASERNSDYFTIEKSYDGLKYELFSKIPAIGNRSSKGEYSVSDLNPNKNGVTYYRLKQFDKGSEIEKFSHVTTLNVYEKVYRLIVQPNPANSNVLITIPENFFGKMATIEVYDNTGNKVISSISEVANGNNGFNININDLPNGFYFIKVSDNMGTILKKSLMKN